MKVLTLNGKKIASFLFCFVCTAVIIYIGIVNHHTVVVTATLPDTVTVALVVDGFGYGHSGTREFLYSDVSFSAVLIENAPLYIEEVRQIENTGREVISEIGDIDAQVVIVSGNNLSSLEDNLKRTLVRSERGENIVVVVQLGDRGAYAAQAVTNITKNFSHIEFVTLSQFLNTIEQ